MKIGFVLDDTLDTPDGVQQYVLTLGAWLGGEGHEVHYLVGQTKRTDLENVHSLSRNIKARFNGNRMSIPMPANRRLLRKFLSRENFDVLHVQTPYSPLLAGRVINAAPANTAAVGTFHIAPHSGIVGDATRLLALLSRRSLKRMSGMLSVSTAAQDFAKQTYGVVSEVLPNVVVVDRFATAVPMPIAGDGPVILFLGRLVPRKGCMILLQAVDRIHQLHPGQRFRVVICGGGPLESELHTYVKKHDLEQIVVFVGYVSEEDKPRYLKAADLAVFPSTGGESFGIVLLEGMAAHHPVVLGAANEGYSTVLKDRTSLLFPVDDPTALAEVIARFLNDPKAQERARNWQQSYIHQFDVATVGPKLLKVYQAAIDQQLLP